VYVCTDAQEIDMDGQTWLQPQTKQEINEINEIKEINEINEYLMFLLCWFSLLGSTKGLGFTVWGL